MVQQKYGDVFDIFNLHMFELKQENNWSAFYIESIPYTSKFSDSLMKSRYLLNRLNKSILNMIIQFYHTN